MPDRLLIRGLVGTPSAILVEDGRIVALDEDGALVTDVEEVDGSGLSAHPGFIELQVNGVDDLDFTSDPGSIGRAGPALARYGVTSYLATIVTSPRGTVEAAVDARRRAVQGPTLGAVPIGLHVEGPFISPARAGAHDPAHLRPPDDDEIATWEPDDVRMVTLAPELPGAIAAIDRLARSGIVPAIGHTDADAATTARGIDAGARYATHLFNGMPPLGHRDPGPVGALLADERMTIGLIADGRHVDPVVLALAARAMCGRLSIVSDGIGDRLGELPLHDGYRADGILAGGSAGLDEGVRTMAALVGPDAAIEAVTATPARLLNLDDGRGFIRLGGRADLVLLTDRLDVARTIVGGRLASVGGS
jgi:N-acetylglucosamine-6-phosphate deacetylase